MVASQVETIALIVALIKNAQDLLSDAEVLLSRERHARAFVLSVLAREEAGKALLVLAKEMGGPDTQARQLTNHREKLLSAAAAELFLFGETPQLFEEARDLGNDKTHDDKMAALYVDLREGEVRTPSCIGSARAEGAYADAKTLLDSLDPILGHLTPEALSIALLLDEQLSPILDQYAETAGGAAAVELARRLTTWGSGQAGISMRCDAGSSAER